MLSQVLDDSTEDFSVDAQGSVSIRPRHEKAWVEIVAVGCRDIPQDTSFPYLEFHLGKQVKMTSSSKKPSPMNQIFLKE